MNAVTTTRWTWADLVSSYRFWALTLYFALMAGSSTLLTGLFPMLIRQWTQLPYSDLGLVLGAQPVGIFCGLLLAWAASRSRQPDSLYLFAGLFVAGTILVCLGGAAVPVLMLGYFLIGLAAGAITLLLPALIAQATGQVETFVLAFGIFMLLKTLASMLAPMTANFSSGHPLSALHFLLLVATPVLIGTLLLLPLKPRLFAEAPPAREVAPHLEKPQAPILTFLLTTFVPFYIFFWFVRIHRDVRSYSQSSSLLTPRGAGWMVFLVPFAIPIILSVLCDCVRGLLNERKTSPGIPTGAVIVASLLFPPLGAALAQSQMNRLIGQR